MLRLSLALLLFATTAAAQERKPSHCIAMADAAPGVEYVQLASFGDPLPRDSVRLSYVSHSTFLIETAGGLRFATDFTGFLGSPDILPDVVTMNHAHESHWTPVPDPRIPHVLRGWTGEQRLELGEALIRNVPTDIRGRFSDEVEVGGNSIYIFEVAGLCIGHLGHLHHEPTPEQYASIGRLDVVMAAVDGGMTIDTASMIRIMERFKARIVLPMHWFSGFALERFLQGMEADFDVLQLEDSWIEVSLDRLPSRPQVIVLRPRPLLLAPSD